MKIDRIVPTEKLAGIPCSILAVLIAKGEAPDVSDYLTKLRLDGYASLDTANKFIRDNLNVKKRIDYKRGQRPKLRDLHLDGKAIVCVYGHFVYLDHEAYWSFFENEADDVVSVWILK